MSILKLSERSPRQLQIANRKSKIEESRAAISRFGGRCLRRRLAAAQRTIMESDCVHIERSAACCFGKTRGRRISRTVRFTSSQRDGDGRKCVLPHSNTPVFRYSVARISSARATLLVAKPLFVHQTLSAPVPDARGQWRSLSGSPSGCFLWNQSGIRQDGRCQYH